MTNEQHVLRMSSILETAKLSAAAAQNFMLNDIKSKDVDATRKFFQILYLDARIDGITSSIESFKRFSGTSPALGELKAMLEDLKILKKSL